MIKRLIFDIDGTLIRGASFTGAIIKTLKEFDSYSEDNLENFLEAIKTYEIEHDNYNKRDYVHHLNKHMGTDLNEEFLDKFFENLRMAVPSEYKEVEETILYLSRKYELVLLSNFFEVSQRNRLEEMGISKYFNEFYGQNIIKPNKEVYKEACGNNLPFECIMIGDNIELDIKVPSMLGLRTILISSKEDSPYGDTIRNISDLKDIL